jgi:hypothetical protein
MRAYTKQIKLFQKKPSGGPASIYPKRAARLCHCLIKPTVNGPSKIFSHPIDWRGIKSLMLCRKPVTNHFPAAWPWLLSDCLKQLGTVRSQ